MKKFIYTSKDFAGHVEFRYTTAGLLFFFDVSPPMTNQELEKILKYLPLLETSLNTMAGILKGKVQEIIDPVTFDTFWNNYNKKINRYRCEKLWDKMKEGTRLLIVKSIPSYDRFLDRTHRFKMDPETYLRNRSWETNWNEV